VIYGLVREELEPYSSTINIETHTRSCAAATGSVWPLGSTNDAESLRRRPVGPSAPHEIRAAYTSRATLTTRSRFATSEKTADRSVADYGWAADEGVRAGELRVTGNSDLHP